MPALIKKFYDAKINNKPEVFCWGTGDPKREFLYVDDLADACIFIIENVPFRSKKEDNNNMKLDELINIGTGKDISIKNLAEMIAQELNYKGKIIWQTSRPNGTPRKLLDVTKINKLGWEAKTKLDKGIKLSIDNYENELKNKSIRT